MTRIGRIKAEGARSRSLRTGWGGGTPGDGTRACTRGVEHGTKGLFGSGIRRGRKGTRGSSRP